MMQEAFGLIKASHKIGVVAQASNPGTWDMEAGGSETQDHPA